MRKIFLFTSVIALTAASAGFAETSVGRVKTIDTTADTVTLADGNNYVFTDNDAAQWLSGFRPGDSVRIDWSMESDQRKADSIASTSVFQDVGKIAAIDLDQKSVKLADGNTFMFDHNDDTRSMLAEFKVGDQVRIAFDHRNNELWGQSIGGTDADVARGVIKAVSLDDGGSVTLEDGQTYSFDPSLKVTDQLTAFRAGDHVSIILEQDGGTAVAETISPTTM